MPERLTGWIGLCSVGAVLCSGGSAALLHGAEARASAVEILPLVWLWGGVALWGAYRTARAPHSESSARTLWLLLLAAALARIPLVGTPPLLSDDVYRYLWEGMVQSAGHNPFLESPASLPGLDDALRARVNHNHLTTVYPPLALAWFRSLHILGGTVPTAQIASVFADLGIVLAIALYGGRAGHGLWPAWLYALHPLPAIESASGAHVDTPAIACAVWACVLWSRSRLPAAILGAIAGAAVKLFPLVILPSLLRRSGIGGMGALALGIAGTAVLALPFVPAGSGLTASLALYTETWSFNGFAFTPLDRLGLPARPLLWGLGLLVGLWTVWRDLDPVRTWVWLGSAFILLSPTVHPWYVLWAMVPGLLVGSWAWSAAALPLMGAYAVLITLADGGSWTEPPWLWLTTWPLAIGALAVAHRHPLRTEPTHSGDPPRHTRSQRAPGTAARPGDPCG